MAATANNKKFKSFNKKIDKRKGCIKNNKQPGYQRYHGPYLAPFQAIFFIGVIEGELWKEFYIVKNQISNILFVLGINHQFTYIENMFFCFRKCFLAVQSIVCVKKYFLP